jgi:hypothetical protein
VSFDTGVLAFECVFNSLMSDAVYSLRTIVFFAFLATSISNLIQAFGTVNEFQRMTDVSSEKPETI